MKVEKSSKIIIVGGHEQACNILEFLVEEGLGEIVICVVRQDDNGEDEVFPSLLKRSKEYNIPTLQPKNLNSNSVIRCISRLEADIVLSLQNNMIFSSEWVSLFKNKLGIVNVHYSPLPKYAGFWPEMWAIYNEEKRFAVTMHYVTDGVDTGPVIAQRWFDINDDDTRRTLPEFK